MSASGWVWVWWIAVLCGSGALTVRWYVLGRRASKAYMMTHGAEWARMNRGEQAWAGKESGRYLFKAACAISIGTCVLGPVGTALITGSP
ncbi:hypothetical protein [Streptomyces sp. NBC_01465]|uniref:hypothetical protein n=1 Tax=Streptomyces sp. NBC_01465 TaxID=2903878 RepID=UPI002E339C57|nr:hypothetical protein [Streptomyces sp. NBC_01465]